MWCHVLFSQVAATPLKKLRAEADRLRQRFEKVQSDIERIEQADARWASGYFPPTDGEVSAKVAVCPK